MESRIGPDGRPQAPDDGLRADGDEQAGMDQDESRKRERGGEQEEDEREPERRSKLPRIQAVGNCVMSISDGVMSRCANDISELYSPPRVSLSATKYRLRSGWALDLQTVQPNGQAWDFNNPVNRLRAKRLLKRLRPVLLIGSPMCTYFSSLVNLSKEKMGERRFRQLYENALSHLKFACEMYEIQLRKGGYFLHEHPAAASSWATDAINKVRQMPGVECVTSDMCQFGMTTRTSDGSEAAVKKPTRWMGNCRLILERLARKCQNDHAHEHLLDGKAAGAAIYPPQLQEAICQGWKEQLEADGRGTCEQEERAERRQSRKEEVLRCKRGQERLEVFNVTLPSDMKYVSQGTSREAAAEVVSGRQAAHLVTRPMR